MRDENGWRPVNKERPCPICNKADWCSISGDGNTVWCGRTPSDRPGKNGGWLHRMGEHKVLHVPHPDRRPRPTASSAEPVDLAQDHQRFVDALAAQPERLVELAGHLGVTADSLRAIGVGWCCGAALRRLRAGGAGWADDYPDGGSSFPERDAGGRITAITFRAPDGRKGTGSGMRRGLTVPTDLHKETTRPVLLVEGASDVAACFVLGLAGLGRPSNTSGADLAATMVEGRELLVVGENDPKADGSWPGRSGAKNVATAIAQTWGDPVPWALPPEGVKDVRDWLRQRVAAGLSLADVESCKAAGDELLAHLQNVAVEAKPGKKPSQSELLARLALERYRLGRTQTDDVFAVSLAGPNIALMLRGSRDSLRGALAHEYRKVTGTTPTAGALADALVALAGHAQDCEAEPVALRVVEHEGGVVLDLGDAAGRAVQIRPGAWELLDTSPVLFRRTALTAALPEPERGGDLAELHELLNVSHEQWALLVGWLAAALVPGIPHPILLMGGLQGTGKTTAARMLAGLFDPSPAPLWSQPRDPEQWVLSAAGSWCIVVDNLSTIPAWWSDSLCKCVTGDGWCRRTLYSDGDLSVVSFRRLVVLTSIDAGSLRGDLADRLLMVDLEPIPDDRRLGEADLDARYREARPRLLGALLDLAAGVLAELPEVHLASMPRMADFARVLAATDAVLGTSALSTFMGQRDRLAGEVIASDVVGEVVVNLAHGGPWSGTAVDLLDRLRPDHVVPGWPRSPRALAGHLRRLTPALQRVGVVVEFSRGTGSKRDRIISIRGEPQPTVQTVRASESPVSGPAGADAARTVPDDPGLYGSPDRPNDAPPGGTVNADPDDPDGSDGALQALSLPDDVEEL